MMKTANPLLVSIAETSFQLDIPIEDVQALIRDGELPTVTVRQHVLVPYESLVKFARRAVKTRKSATSAALAHA